MGSIGTNPLTHFVKDGAATPVSKDTDTPANTVPLPVELVGAGGSGATLVEIAAGSQGTTTPFTGTATTAPAAVPAVAGNVITDWLVRSNTDNPATRRLQFSFDGGANYFSLRAGEAMSGTFLTTSAITQLLVKTAASTAQYEIILNRVP